MSLKEIKKWLTYSVFVLGHFGVLKLSAALALATQAFDFRLNLLRFSLWFLRLPARLIQRKQQIVNETKGKNVTVTNYNTTTTEFSEKC